jgi:ABC-2 type transport system permease protein
VAGNALVAMDSALVQLPAVWLTTALVVALYGFAPRQAGLAWGVLVIFLLLGQLGSILQLPQWALDLSPFTHVPAPPGPIRALPLVVMSVLAVAVGALGLAGLRRRDIA